MRALVALITAPELTLRDAVQHAGELWQGKQTGADNRCSGLSGPLDSDTFRPGATLRPILIVLLHA